MYVERGIMWYFILKVFISALIIALISWISQKSSLLGAILASVPLTSLLAILWLFRDTHDLVKISNLCKDIFWLVLPSLAFFLILPFMIKHKYSFGIAMTVSVVVVAILYYLTILILKRSGV
jgi:hypothetical protein